MKDQVWCIEWCHACHFCGYLVLFFQPIVSLAMCLLRKSLFKFCYTGHHTATCQSVFECWDWSIYGMHSYFGTNMICFVKKMHEFVSDGWWQIECMAWFSTEIGWNIYVLCKVWVGTIWGLSCANLGSELCATNPRIVQVCTSTLLHHSHITPCIHIYADWTMAYCKAFEKWRKNFTSTKNVGNKLRTEMNYY